MEILRPKSARGKKVKYLCIAAHQDDVEIMAYHGILKGLNSKSYSFSAVVTCDGGGSARSGVYASYSDDDMKQVRIKEQLKAAELGKYEHLFLLNKPSSEVKMKVNDGIIYEYIDIILMLKPEVIYTHNLLDKHPTHIGVVTKVIEALRRIDKKDRPKLVLGCEVWRDLDWVKDDRKIALDVSKRPKLAKDILNVFDSQIAGGKRYDLAAIGRRYANATFSQSHSVDTVKAITYAIDLTPLINNANMSIKDYALSFVSELENDIKAMMEVIAND